MLQWLGISAFINAIDAQPWVPDANSASFPDGHYSLGQLFAAMLVFLAVAGFGLLLLPLLVRLLRHQFPASSKGTNTGTAKGGGDDVADAKRFLNLLQRSFHGPLRALLLLFPTTLSTCSARAIGS